MDRALAFTAKAATCPGLLQRVHTLLARVCTHTVTHTLNAHIHILHIYTRAAADLTHI